MKTSIKVDNGRDTVKINDWVCFKNDVEMSGRLVEINGNMLTLQSGDDTYVETADRCWFEG